MKNAICRCAMDHISLLEAAIASKRDLVPRTATPSLNANASLLLHQMLIPPNKAVICHYASRNSQHWFPGMVAMLSVEYVGASEWF
jgi:hypothetical protein